MIMVNETGKQQSLIGSTLATSAQKTKFKETSNQYGDRFIGARVELNLLIILYKTKFGNIIQAIYNSRGVLLHKHFFNHERIFLFTKYFYYEGTKGKN